MPTRYLSALEHQPIPISSDGAGWSLTSAEVERLAQIGELRPGFCEVGTRKVKLAQYCGLVGLGERVLEVLPKTQDSKESADECRGVLLRLLRLTAQFPQFQHQSVGQHFRRGPLLEAFISAFFDSVALLMRGGLLKKYLEHEEDLRVVRGRISIAQQLIHHSNRPDVVACAFDELTTDNVWNRVLKKAIRSTRPWIRGMELNRRWVELMGALDEVDDRQLTGTDVMRLSFDRRAERYRTAIGWARWILTLLAPALRAGPSQAPALLFDMNKLFESAVATVLGRAAASHGSQRVVAQETARTLATIVSPGRQEPGFALRPDLVIHSDSGELIIADTKWKLVDQDRLGRLIPAQSDLYQMHAYASAYGCSDLALIYPWRSDLASPVDTELRLPLTNGRIPIVKILLIDVHDDELPLRSGVGSAGLGSLFRRAAA